MMFNVKAASRHTMDDEIGKRNRDQPCRSWLAPYGVGDSFVSVQASGGYCGVWLLCWRVLCYGFVHEVPDTREKYQRAHSYGPTNNPYYYFLRHMQILI